LGIHLKLNEVNNLCLRYGPLVGYVESHPFHDFPTPEALSGPNVESELRALGFGYRAKYLAQTAKMVAKDKPNGWLDDLSNKVSFDGSAIDPLEEGGRPGYRKAHEELLQLQGVGPKVADCVCLMGLGWGESVPVDTHVWQIAQRDYKFGKGKHKSLTKATYDAVGDHFRRLWGKEAGWAHSVLFAADLRTFAVRLTEKTEEMVEIIVKEERSAGAETIISLKRELKAEVVIKGEQLEDEKITQEILEIRKAKRKRY
jgi:N-glycosylase/DNA lyase